MSVRGPVLVFVAMLFGAAAFIIAKFAMDATDGLVFSCIISGFGAVFCGAWAWLDGDIAPPKPGERGRWLFLGHVLGSVVGAGSLWSAIETLDPALVSIVSRAEIVISLTLAALFLRERFRPVEWLGAAVVIAGVVIMKLASTGTLALSFNSSISKGFLFSLTAAAGYAASEVFAKAGTHSASPPAFAFYRNLAMMALFALLVAVRGNIQIPEPRVFAIAAAAAMGGPVIARVLWFRALHLMPLSRAVLLAQTHPLWTALLSWLVLGLTLTVKEWAGAAVLLSGCLVVAAGGAVGRRTPAPVPPLPVGPAESLS